MNPWVRINMCGILGLIDSRIENNFQEGYECLFSRGPDAQNFWRDKNITLAHTRLSVIDLIEGNQPMISEDGRFVLVFNGEIYNFQELRSVLRNSNFNFKTNSDTEVVLNGFIKWGKKVVRHLDGMFAFAIWDKEKKRLFAARDRVGIKPFFYSESDGFIFSSSLKSFIDLRGFRKNLNYEAVRDFLSFQTCLAPETFLRGVFQLPPASTLSWTQKTKKSTIEKYWSPSETNYKLSYEECLEETDFLLSESVKSQMISDVPLGAFLSGGIDSSLMIYYMSKAGVKNIDAFTVRFNQQGFDESVFADEVAKFFRLDHHLIDAPSIDGELWSSAIHNLDQPLADAAYVMTSYLSQQTRKKVTVAISGDGGDELFAGYPRFQIQPKNFPKKFYSSSLRFLIDHKFLPGALNRRALFGEERIYYNHVELGEWERGRKSFSRYVNKKYINLLNTNNTMSLWKKLAGGMGTKELMDADLWTYLSENCLTKTDRASMSNSLEVRVPMLGNSILNFATSIPTEYHFDEFGGKKILKALAKRHLPESVWNRKKHGFSVPLQDLFNSSWGERMDELFAGSKEITPFLNHSEINKLWFQSKKKRASRRLAYTFAVLLEWLSYNKIS